MPSERILTLRRKAASLPLCPGVYLMKDAEGTVIYVGKSRHLKNRVSSYFADTDHGPKTARMVSRVADFDYILCDTEMEALTLENVLIKQYTPRYNIKLKDAKSYPYIKITAGPWPRIEVSRTRREDGAAYFGPYRSSATAHSAAETVSAIFALPVCHRSFPRDIGRERPCLYRQMGRCCAPCVPDISEADYRALMASARKVFMGNTKEAEGELRRRMYEASEAERFELAARYRNSLEALAQLSEKQKVVTSEQDERDVFALYEGDVSGVLAVLQIRCGKLMYKNEYVFSAGELTGGGDIAALLYDYYSTADPPREILLDRELDEESAASLSDWLSQKANRRVTVRTPKRGDLKKLCDMAAENARHRAEARREADTKAERTLARLAMLLGLEVLPGRIEAYDISNLGNEYITCSMVVYCDGVPKRADYRTFRIKTTDGADDYAAMHEALSRRLAHIGDGSPSLGEAPDLILLDGGVGHVHTVRPLADRQTPPIPVFGMVKDDFHKTRCLTDGERDISIAGEQGLFVFIYGIQEEVHRVAVRGMMGAKRRTLKHSSLEKIPGIGPAKAALLLKVFGTLSAIREADVETLSSAKGITLADAVQIHAYFQKQKEQKDQKQQKPPSGKP